MINKKIIFFGTSEFAVPFLEALINNNADICLVVTQPDKPQGRKQELVASPIKNIAINNNLSLIQPSKLKISDFRDYQADLGILVSYGQILKSDILNLFPFGILNIHPSLLPKYRGPSPIQSALANDDFETGVSLMLLDKKMDAGPIISQKKINISADDNYTSLHQQLAEMGVKILLDNIELYCERKILPKPQNQKDASICKIIKKQDGRIDLFNDKSVSIINKLRAYKEWPGIYFIYNDKRFKIKKAHIQNNILKIDIIQPEGKKEMSWDDFKCGYEKSLPKFFSSIKA
ncbi:MAG: methionyl-tRNA formyltransferase [Patescibacteria group bacterium]